MAIKEGPFCIEILEKINSLDWLIFRSLPPLKKEIYGSMERRKKKRKCKEAKHYEAWLISI